MTANDERGLLNRAQAFDRDALERIYDRFSPKLFAYACRLLGDPALAEECLADTFSRFLLALQAGRGPTEHLQAYLYRIAHNWIADRFRHSAAAREIELTETLPDPASPGVERSAEDRILAERLRRALLRLTDEQRMVVTLRFLEGWSLEEVAESMRKDIGAVKAMQHRALAALRRRMDNVDSDG